MSGSSSLFIGLDYWKMQYKIITSHSESSLDIVKIIMFQVEKKIPEMSVAIHFG